MAVLPRLNVGLALDSATFIAETRRVSDSVNRMGRDVNRQTSAITSGFNAAAAAVKGFAVGFVSIEGATRLATAARSTLAWADALQEASQRVGVTVEQLQKLQLAGERTNVSQRR
jgi:hypothetical protein